MKIGLIYMNCESYPRVREHEADARVDIIT